MRNPRVHASVVHFYAALGDIHCPDLLHLQLGAGRECHLHEQLIIFRSESASQYRTTLMKGEIILLNKEPQKSVDVAQNETKDLRKRPAGSAPHPVARRPLRPAVVPKPLVRPPVQGQDLTIDDRLPSPVPHGNFREVDWTGANLNGCDATGADFSAATLIEICALGANLSAAQLEEAQLQNAALCGANLTQANLRNADLRNANLTWCNLGGAMLRAVDLRGANLAWADLRNADLRQVNLKGAYYNHRTQWPHGFDPTAAQMVCLAESR